MDTPTAEGQDMNGLGGLNKSPNGVVIGLVSAAVRKRA
jgi:hypothetical protein